MKWSENRSRPRKISTSWTWQDTSSHVSGSASRTSDIPISHTGRIWSVNVNAGSATGPHQPGDVTVGAGHGPGDVEPVADDGGVDVDVDRAGPGDDGATVVVAAETRQVHGYAGCGPSVAPDVTLVPAGTSVGWVTRYLSLMISGRRSATMPAIRSDGATLIPWRREGWRSWRGAAATPGRRRSRTWPAPSTVADRGWCAASRRHRRRLARGRRRRAEPVPSVSASGRCLPECRPGRPADRRPTRAGRCSSRCPAPDSRASNSGSNNADLFSASSIAEQLELGFIFGAVEDAEPVDDIADLLVGEIRFPPAAGRTRRVRLLPSTGRTAWNDPPASA